VRVTNGNSDGNVAFDGMTNVNDNTAWTVHGNNGADITLAEILADPGMSYRFTADNGWTLVPGKLPGLLGAAVDIPAYMSAAAQ
jgi:hypothetical protein